MRPGRCSACARLLPGVRVRSSRAAGSGGSPVPGGRRRRQAGSRMACPAPGRRPGRRGLTRGAWPCHLPGTVAVASFSENGGGRGVLFRGAGANRPGGFGARVISLRDAPGTRVIRRQAERPAQSISEPPAAGIAIPRRLSQRLRQDAVHRRRKVQAAARSAAAAAPTCAPRSPPRPDHAGTASHRRATRTPRTPASTGRPARPPACPHLLRRRIARGPQELPRPGQAQRGHRTLAQPEIRQVHVIGPARPGIHQHVRRLDITMHQTRAMRGVQSRSHRRDDRRHRPGESGPTRRTKVRTSPPGTYRIAMNSTPSASPASNTGMMCGSSTAAAARDSRMNRCRNASSAASAGARIFSATHRPSRSSRARNTTAIPPAPIRSSSHTRPSANPRQSQLANRQPPAATPHPPCLQHPPRRSTTPIIQPIGSHTPAYTETGTSTTRTR